MCICLSPLSTSHLPFLRAPLPPQTFSNLLLYLSKNPKCLCYSGAIVISHFRHTLSFLHHCLSSVYKSVFSNACMFTGIMCLCVYIHTRSYCPPSSLVYFLLCPYSVFLIFLMPTFPAFTLLINLCLYTHRIIR